MKGQRPRGEYGRPVNSRHVAAAAGVAQSTVSRALTGHPSVDPATRAKVLEVAESLGYIPNAVARSLISSRTRLLGLLVSNITDAYVPDLIEGVTSAAFDRDYTTIIGSVQERSELQASYLRMLAGHRVDGAILTSGLLGSVGEIEPLIRQGLRIVLANREIDGLEIDAVVIDNVAAAKLATEHLLEHGRRRIAYVGGRPDAATSRDRLIGYRAALERRSIELDPENVLLGSFSRSFGYEASLELLQRPTIPDAILAGDDTVALGCLDAIADSGLRVPDDISIVGFGDQAAASLRAISLTTIHISAQDIGAKAVDLLIDRIEGVVVGPPTKIILPHMLLPRRSCGPHASAEVTLTQQ